MSVRFFFERDDIGRSWEYWDLEFEGTKTAFRSHHGSYLSSLEEGGYALVPRKGGREMFSVEDVQGRMAFRGCDGSYLSAALDHLKQVEMPSGFCLHMDFEVLTSESWCDGCKR